MVVIYIEPWIMDNELNKLNIFNIKCNKYFYSVIIKFINYIIKMDQIEIGIILIIMLFLFIGIPVICICYNFMKKKENILYKEETNKILSY